MGGYGSGRQNGATITDDCLAIDVRRWQRDGLLVAGIGFTCTWSSRGETTGNIHVTLETGQARLVYHHKKYGGEWQILDYPVKLQTPPCHYGGVRYWFICPAVGCGKRVTKLYLGGRYFACRHCYRLAYPSQREAEHDRLIRKADKLRKKLDWEPGILNGGGWKPKGMHWKTFWRLQAEHDQYAEAGINGWMEKLDRCCSKRR